MKEELKLKLLKQAEIIELLEAYSLFLEERGYMDMDWRAEEPLAIGEFLKENKKWNITKRSK